MSQQFINSMVSTLWVLFATSVRMACTGSPCKLQANWSLSRLTCDSCENCNLFALFDSINTITLLNYNRNFDRSNNFIYVLLCPLNDNRNNDK